MITAQTSVTVSARVVGEISSAVATTTQIVADPTVWELIINFFKAIF